MLQKIAAVYREQPQQVTQNVEALRDALGQLATPKRGDAIPLDVIVGAGEQLLSEVDPVHGGIGQAPKFPQTPVLELMWRGWKQSGNAQLRDAVVLTLTCMSQGGIYDHVGGGFARYSVDAEWLAPHFEKMLYDNAQLIDLLTLVWQETKAPLFRARVQETVGWALREMLAAPTRAGHRASPARSTPTASMRKASSMCGARPRSMPPRRRCRALQVDLRRDAGRQLGRPQHPQPSPTPICAMTPPRRELAAPPAALFAIRAKRVRPGWDDKVLADWNGLMIAALANAAQVFEQPSWLAAAIDAFAFVTGSLAVDGRLRHSWRDGRAKHPATLDDHAQLCRAALALHEATGDDRYLRQAQEWVDLLDRHYRDENGGGYFFAADDTADIILRTKNAADNATPSGNGALVGVLARLFYLTGEDRYRARADEVIATFSGELDRSFFSLATLLNSNELLQTAQQIVVIGDRAAADTRALAAAVFGRSLPNRILSVIAPAGRLPEGHPAAGKTQVAGRATAYVCRGTTCSLPITAPSGLSQALAIG